MTNMKKGKCLGNWKLITVMGAPTPHALHVSVQADSKVLIWWGRRNMETHWPAYGDGALYDVEGDSWKSISYIKSPSPRAFSSGVWTGNQLIIWGGSDETSVLSDGSSYDPYVDSWSPISPAPIGSRT